MWKVRFLQDFSNPGLLGLGLWNKQMRSEEAVEFWKTMENLYEFSQDANLRLSNRFSIP